MLLLFVTSITPKRFLHHWFADHKDVQAKLATHSLLGHGEAQLYSSGVNCDCNDLVATSPFTHATEIIDWTVPVCYGQPIVPLTCDTYSTDLLLSNLRGPPSQA
jgi:hypothetical protein